MAEDYTDDDMMHGRASRSDVKAGLQQLLESAQELLRTTASYSGAEIEAARGRLKQQISMAEGQAGDYGTVMKDRLHQVCEAADECVHTHPWKVVGLAALAGLIMGKCMAAKE